SLAFELNEADLANWPLISYLIDIPAYRATYDAYIDDFIHTAFDPTKMQGEYSAMKSLIQSSVDKESNGYTYLTGSFDDAVTTITTHTSTRYTAAINYLN
ncbi:MAG: CotH kinase family protein, partial [Aureispira sp.]|nr:CotH kinase family protein [Aureispira sp.]